MIIDPNFHSILMILKALIGRIFPIPIPGLHLTGVFNLRTPDQQILNQTHKQYDQNHSSNYTGCYNCNCDCGLVVALLLFGSHVYAVGQATRALLEAG